MRVEVRGTYPDNWPEISRAIKAGAGWRCIRCRHPFDHETAQPLPCDANCDISRGRVDRQLDRRELAEPQLSAPHVYWRPGLNYGVHHADGDRGNSRWWNLMPLCNSCHLWAQGRAALEQGWMFEYSPWMLPYACGFFAFHVVGLEITRADAVADPDRWLRLGQPWRQEIQVAHA